MPAEQRASNDTAQTQGQQPSGQISEKLVKEVTEKVFALMLRDLKISRERFRGSHKTPQRRGGS